MLGSLYICCSAGDTVKRPLEAQGDRPHRSDELESNLLFALGVSALAASSDAAKAAPVPNPENQDQDGWPAGLHPISGLGLCCRASLCTFRFHSGWRGQQPPQHYPQPWTLPTETGSARQVSQ